jgi:hypothetical protein
MDFHRFSLIFIDFHRFWRGEAGRLAGGGWLGGWGTGWQEEKYDFPLVFSWFLGMGGDKRTDDQLIPSEL